jgi:quaternary ammonium compound-resistance protein SugE
MHWPALFIAGLLEIVWVIAMKQSNGFSRIIPSVVTFCAAGTSFWLLAYAMKALPLGTSYAIWTGVGIISAFIAGVTLFGEQASLLRVGSVGLIIIGMIGLRLAAE